MIHSVPLQGTEHQTVFPLQMLSYYNFLELKTRKPRPNSMIQNKRWFTTLAICLLLPAFTAGSCSDDLSVDPDAFPEKEIVLDRVDSEEASFRVVRVIDDLQNPWGMAWLPDGRMIITERPGRINLVDNRSIAELDGLPEIHATGQGGLLDVAIHPDYEENGWIYFTWSASDDGNTGTSLSRARLGDGALTDLEMLYTEEPNKSPGRHYGSRIAFPGDGTVVITIGDRGRRSPAQNLNDPAGSTIRLNDDGTIPDDNPFVDRDDVLPEIYSYGHRNAQGMAIHPETGRIWQHEHGPQGGDELNIIRPGRNYGWPDATYGDEYGSGRSIGVDPHEDPGIVDPLVYWSPTSIAPSGMTFYTGNNFPAWQGDIFLGALAQRHIRRVVIDGEEVIHQEELLRDELGRIRDVKEGPDGNIYVLTDESSGGLYRLEPLN